MYRVRRVENGYRIFWNQVEPPPQPFDAEKIYRTRQAAYSRCKRLNGGPLPPHRTPAHSTVPINKALLRKVDQQRGGMTRREFIEQLLVGELVPPPQPPAPDPTPIPWPWPPPI